MGVAGEANTLGLTGAGLFGRSGRRSDRFGLGADPLTSVLRFCGRDDARVDRDPLSEDSSDLEEWTI